MNGQVKSKNIDVSQVVRKSADNDMDALEECLVVKNLDLYYGDKQALQDINLSIPRKRVTAFIGPSGCGKSTLLRCFNRMNDLVDGCVINGTIELDGMDIYKKSVDVADLRRRV